MRLVRQPLSLSFALVLAACSDGGGGPTLPEPLAITSRSPAPDAPNVEAGTTVAVVFSQAIDPATLTAATFQVKQAGAPLPAALSYDAASRTAKAAAPFLPDVIYEVEVTTGVRTPAGTALDASAVWSFTTRAWPAITVDADGDVGVGNSLALDASGRLHVTYFDETNILLNYATCAAGCAAAANWHTIAVDASPPVGSFTSLALDATGHLHASYQSITDGDLKYITCAADCTSADNWFATIVEADGSVGYFTSLAVDAGGRLHVTHWDEIDTGLRYATCAADCDAGTNWQTTAVDTVGFTGQDNSLAADASGRLHVSYFGGVAGHLRYATCAGDCASAANWQAETVDADANVGTHTSLVVEGSGRLHVSYYDQGNGNLKYATCATGCISAASWQIATVDATGDVGLYTSLAVDGNGRIHVSYHERGAFDLKYATCALACVTAANWRSATVDADGNVGSYTSLAVGASGRLHISYWDETNRDLKYIE